ncbi:hypothetical protein PHISCL_00208 [Aspergillus sclerotialis]|uniref:Uncharacterized protein n=1 Tax=Aspergillus sclerotialis TaxID=2070753 RepID=A0A3A3A6X9_9EURO|nr:hypothetical protein PHISCL_00208 [Aspergillus sclerotialis]
MQNKQDSKYINTDMKEKTNLPMLTAISIAGIQGTADAKRVYYPKSQRKLVPRILVLAAMSWE